MAWPKSKFRDLRKWIDGGGLAIIKHWAENFGDYVDVADRAPMTERKKEMIEGSRSEAQAEAVALAESLADSQVPGAMAMKDVVMWVRQASQGRVFDSDYELRKAMTEAGLRSWPKRVKISGRLQNVVMNELLWDEAKRNKADSIETIREACKKPSEFMESAM